MYLYHIILANGTTLEIPAENQKEAMRKTLYPQDVEEIYAMPITSEILVNSCEKSYTTDLGSVTYTIKHWADQDGIYYTVEASNVDAEMEVIDDLDYDSYVEKLSSLDGDTGYNSIEEANREIDWTLNEAEEIFENATHIQAFDEDAAYDEWRCNH